MLVAANMAAIADASSFGAAEGIWTEFCSVGPDESNHRNELKGIPRRVETCFAVMRTNLVRAGRARIFSAIEALRVHVFVKGAAYASARFRGGAPARLDALPGLFGAGHVLGGIPAAWPSGWQAASDDRRRPGDELVVLGIFCAAGVSRKERKGQSLFSSDVS